MNKTSEDGIITFDVEKHRYTNTITAHQPESVTGYIKRHCTPFDADFHATNYAIKHKMEKQAVLDMWSEKGRTAAIQGTQAHAILEGYASTGRMDIVEPCKHIEGIQALIKGLYTSGEYEIIKTEHLLYDDQLCGICDVIVKNKAGEYIMLDYKTNKAISTFSYKKMMLKPYEYLPDANFYHYSLQLSLYQRMCREYKIKKCFIVHLTEKSYKVIPAQNIFLTR